MALTPKQEKFAQCIADGMTQADAYRSSFDVAPTTKPESVIVNASKLMADANISQRVAEVRAKLEEKALWTRMDSVRTLSEIAKGGDPEAKSSDRVNAVKALNSMHGWDAPQKVDHTSSDGTMSPRPVLDASKLSSETLQELMKAADDSDKG